MRSITAGTFAAVLACTAWSCRSSGHRDSTDPGAAEPEASAALAAAGTAAAPPAAAGTTVDLEGGSGAGGNRWRDAGVYVDGVPVGVMWFGELPLALQPVWKEDYQMLEFSAGDKGPHERKVKYRRYRIAEYLEALGVDLRQVKVMHLYAPSGFPAVIPGRVLRRHRDDLLFSFGRETTGKPLIYFPADMKVNTTFDHIGAIAVYIHKKPPVLTPDEDDVVLDGKSVWGEIPYFGEPIRGGIRIYKDDRLAVTIKRKRLQESLNIATKDASGELRWNMLQFLEAHGVATADLVAAEVVDRDQRTVRFDRDQLVGTWFTAHPSASGELLLNAEQVPMEALMLYTRALPPRAN